MQERDFQRKFIVALKQMFPGCLVLKNDSLYVQGIPDLLILHEDKWAAFELKRDGKSRRRPNQEFYVDRLSKMSFAAFVSPENMEEVLYAVQLAFESDR